MTITSRETVRDEIVAGVSTAVTGSGKPFASVYGYMKGTLNGESPVLLVLNGPIQRRIQGIGSKRYNNSIDLELHILIYDGDENNPLTEQQREDKMDECELVLATHFATHQSGTSYESLNYTPSPTEPTNVKYLDGNPYKLEVVKVQLEAPDK